MMIAALFTLEAVNKPRVFCVTVNRESIKGEEILFWMVT